MSKKLFIYFTLFISLKISGQTYSPEKILSQKTVKLKKQKFKRVIKYELDGSTYFFDEDLFGKIPYTSLNYIFDKKDKVSFLDKINKQESDTVYLNPYITTQLLANYTKECLIEIILKKKVFILKNEGGTVSELIIKKVRDGETSRSCYRDGIAIYTHDNKFLLYKLVSQTSTVKFLE